MFVSLNILTSGQSNRAWHENIVFHTIEAISYSLKSIKLNLMNCSSAICIEPQVSRPIVVLFLQKSDVVTLKQNIEDIQLLRH